MKISIVIPVYNAEKYLDKCLRSFINQTYKNIEIIIVNDGSTDNSLEIMNEYKKKDNRIIIITQENSGGVIARENGILNATGEYVLLSDSDDWVDLNYIEMAVNKLKEFSQQVDIIKYGYYSEPFEEKKLLLDNGLKEKIFSNEEVNCILEKLIYSNMYNQVWNQFVKRELFDFNDCIYNKIVHKGEDLQINLQLYTRAKSVAIINECYYHYEKNPNSITTNCNVDKIISNIKDCIYLHEIKEKIAIKKFGNCDNIALKNMTLDLLYSKITSLMMYSKNLKNDLIKIQDNLNNEMSNYLDNFKYYNIQYKNPIKKQIIMNIIKNNYLKNIKYSFLYKLNDKRRKYLINRKRKYLNEK